jgi:hypothetical protein
MTRRDLIRKGAVAAAVGTAAVTIPWASTAAAKDGGAEGRGRAALGAIYQLQAAFHRAKSHQDIDLMASLWAEDATLQLGGTTYAGRDAVRAFFLASGSWLHHRISLVPSFKDQIEVRDDGTAYLYFECHDVALTDESAMVPAGTVVTHLFNAGRVRPVGGDWLFQDMHGGPAAPLSVDTIFFP